MNKNSQWIVRCLALAVFAAGVLNVVSAISPTLPERLKTLKEIFPLVLVHGSRHLTVMAGFLLIIIARGISRRKRAAWWITFVLLLSSVILHLLKGLDFEEAAFSAFVTVLMLVFYPVFIAKSDLPTVMNAFRILVAVIFFNIFYGVLGFHLLHKSLGVNPSLPAYLQETLSIMFSLSTAKAVPATPHSRWFLSSLWLMWECGILIFILMVLKPVIYRRRTWAHEHKTAKELAERYGNSSLVYFTLLPDKYYFFNSSRTCYISFCQIGDVAVALGDPVGPPSDIETTVCEFNDFCTSHGWYPTFYQVLPDHIPVYKKLGLSVLHIGDEAVVDLQKFDLTGKKFKKLRNIQHKFLKNGFRAVWHEPPLPDNLILSLEEVSKEWLKYQGGEEKAFSLGWFDPSMIRETPVITVEDAKGIIYAFANFVPMYHLCQASPDLMRYSSKAPAGIMDFLLVESMLHFKAQGVQGFNLGLAPLARADAGNESGIIEKAIHFLYKNFYNFKGLHNYKAKFNPQWEPRFLVYPNLTVLPKAALAVIKAGNPSGFIKFWRWWATRIKTRIKMRTLLKENQP